MSGNSFGTIFRITSFGESHGVALGVTIDGVPPGLSLDKAEIDAALARRRPGQSAIVTQRKEPDECEILSGVAGGKTLGTPIGVIVRNVDARPEAYSEMREAYRPSHADFTYDAKYGLQAASGGGRSSARETVARVIGGVVAEKILTLFAVPSAPIEIVAYVKSVADLKADIDPDRVTREDVEKSIVRTPDVAASERMIALIEATRKAGDSVGGVIECVARNLPAGLGNPVFDKADALLGQALFSLPAVKGVEIGSGFAGTQLRGSSHNDAFVMKDGRVATKTNRSGGIQGGITNGESVIVRAAFKPTSTIMMEQETVTRDRKPSTLKGKGRHDPCVLPRAVPIVEAMVALVFADLALRQRAQCGL